MPAMLDLAMDQSAAPCIAYAVHLVPTVAETSRNVAAFEAPAWKTGEPVLGRAVDLAPKTGSERYAKLLRVLQVGHRIADAVERRAGPWMADVIVIGTKGRHGVSRAFPGSGGNSVARGAAMPVSLVRGR